jgi:hypothetical protein
VSGRLSGTRSRLIRRRPIRAADRLVVRRQAGRPFACDAAAPSGGAPLRLGSGCGRVGVPVVHDRCSSVAPFPLVVQITEALASTHLRGRPNCRVSGYDGTDDHVVSSSTPEFGRIPPRSELSAGVHQIGRPPGPDSIGRTRSDGLDRTDSIGSNGEQDLAHVFARLDDSVGFGDVGEREAPVDDRAHVSVGDKRPDILDDARHDRGLPGDRTRA